MIPPDAPGGAPRKDSQAPARSSEPAASPAPEQAAPASASREFTLPAGTVLQLVLDTGVASDVSSAGDEVRAHLLDPVRVGDADVLPQGTPLVGAVTTAERPGKVQGLARVAFSFSRIEVHGARYPIATRAVARTAKATKSKDALKIGAGAGGGALVGGLVGGRKGAAIGTAVGGGAGTAVVLSTRGEDIRLARGAPVRVTLSEPLTIRVPVR